MAENAHYPTRRIAVSGYYGFRNSGDEAVLRSILLALEEQGEAQGVRIEPVVLSADPAWTAKMYGVEAAPRMHPASLLRTLRSCDGLISGGGSLLQDATGAKTIPYYTGVIKLAQWLGKPTFIYSQGIGPVNRRWMDPLIAHVMKKSAYISVRDAESAALLARMGVPQDRIEVVPDPVMGLPLPADAAAASGAAAGRAEGGAAGGNAGDGVPVVGVSLRRWRPDGADLDRAADALAALAASRPVRLRFLPFHTPDDAETSRDVMKRLEGRLGAGSAAELAEPGDDPQRMLLEVSRCDILFGMRLHALIYAANRSVPMLGLSYDPKIDQFLARLELQAVGTTEKLDSGVFAAEAVALLDRRAEWQREHAAAIDGLRQQAQQPAQQIAKLLRQLNSR
ncbi:polysaccharide pyruvyl transferase CsaB [Paenibacillus thailandensis]|uniref:Polysaccharide pyruvyl transferase CsaB n=1 Tax=Paenibacillus thailandensis TaxID=393250 RepID=A0ABW5R3T8_9BACL